MQSTYYADNEVTDLAQKINNKFIRPPFKFPTIPNSSDILEQPSPMRPYEPIPRKILPPYTPPPPPQFVENYATPAPTCIDVADHTTNCPVCSKLYKNTNGALIAILVLLVLLVIFLLKRLLTEKK